MGRIYRESGEVGRVGRVGCGEVGRVGCGDSGEDELLLHYSPFHPPGPLSSQTDCIPEGSLLWEAPLPDNGGTCWASLPHPQSACTHCVLPSLTPLSLCGHMPWQ